jgi:hypothetical protein
MIQKSFYDFQSRDITTILIGLNIFKTLLHFDEGKKIVCRSSVLSICRYSLSLFFYYYYHLFISINCILEKKDNANVSNYRSASELSFLAKIDLRSGDGSI